MRCRARAVDEHNSLAFVATGAAQPAGVHGKPEPLNFFHLKGDVEQLLAAFDAAGIHEEVLVAHSDDTCSWQMWGTANRSELPSTAPCPRGCIRAAPHAPSSWQERRKDARHLRPASSRSRRRAQAQAGSFRRGDISSRRSTSSRCVSPPTLRSRSIRRWSATFPSFCPRAWSLKASVRSSPRWRLPSLRRSFRRKLSVAAHSPQEPIRSSCASASSPAERTLRDDEVASWSQQIVKAVESLGGSLRQ